MLRFAICLAAAGRLLAQHQGMTPPPENPVMLYKGMGIWRHPIHTSSAEAQKYFDQGLALMYGFNRYEATRSFKKAAELDPKAAMAEWGLAMSAGPYVNMDLDPTYDMKASCAAVDAGLKIAGTPENERAYLEAAAARCPDFAKPEAYIAAMRTLASRYPDDLDAVTLYAESLMLPTRWHWYQMDGSPAAGEAEAEHVLEGVLRRWPDHPGANHLYIHAVESSPVPERAVASAQRLMGEVPAAGHLVHMPAHIWLVLGDWEMAATVNERAAQVDREYFAASKVNGVYTMYYIHNLHFVSYARWMQGKKAAGFQAADLMAKEIAPLGEAMPDMADPFLAMPIFARVRFAAWDDILKMPQPKDAYKASNMVWHYARALAMSAKGDRAGAAKERDIFETSRQHVPADAPWGNSKASDVMSMASEIVAARLTSAAEAVPHWEKAVALQDGLAYDEPPEWYYPVRESLGAALLRAGKAAEAEKVFREGVKRSPRNGRMLFGLMESLKAAGKTEAAESVRKEFEAAWAKADVKLRIEEM